MTKNHAKKEVIRKTQQNLNLSYMQTKSLLENDEPNLNFSIGINEKDSNNSIVYGFDRLGKSRIHLKRDGADYSTYIELIASILRQLKMTNNANRLQVWSNKNQNNNLEQFIDMEVTADSVIDVMNENKFRKPTIVYLASSEDINDVVITRLVRESRSAGIFLILMDEENNPNRINSLAGQLLDQLTVTEQGVSVTIGDSSVLARFRNS